MRYLSEYTTLLGCCALLSFAGSCRSDSKSNLGQNRVVLEDAADTKNIGDDEIRYRVIPNHKLDNTLNKAPDFKNLTIRLYRWQK